MAKASKVEQIVAEMENEQRIVDQCVERLRVSGTTAPALEEHSAMLTACIARLTSNGSEPMPKPARTRRGRKPSEPSI